MSINSLTVDDETMKSLNHAMVYKSMKNNKFILKKDVFPCLRELIFLEFPNLQLDQFSNSRISKFIAEKERLIHNFCDFISVSDYNSISVELANLFKDNWSAHPRAAAIMNEFMNKIGRPVIGTEEELSAIAELFRCQKGSKKSSEFVCSIVMKSLQEIIERRPDVFLPSPAGLEKLHKIVRIFTDDKKKFVMTAELEMVLNGASSSSNQILTTIDGSMALRTALSSKEDIEFLMVPIIRTPAQFYHAFPIPTPSGGFCKLSADVLLFLIQTMIFHFIPFQKDAESAKRNQDQFIANILEHFPVTEESEYFIEEAKVDMLGTLLKQQFEEDEQTMNRHEREKIIIEKGKMKAVSGKKMVADVIAKHPDLAKFMHNQKACNLLVHNECCGKKESAEEEMKTTTLLDEVLKALGDAALVQELVPTLDISKENSDAVVAKKKKNKRRKSKAAKIQVATPEEAVTPGAESFPLDGFPELMKILEAFESPVKENSEVKEAEVVPETQIQETKESSTCQKCFRTAERCKEAKEKLKEAENLIKKLTKKTAESERKQSKAEQELEELKRKFAAYQEEQEAEQKALKVQLTQSEEEKELLRAEKKQLQVEKDQLVEENKKVQEQFALDQHVPEPVKEAEEEEDPIDYEKMLDDLQDKYLKLNEADPLGDAVRKVRKLKGLTEDEQVQMFAESELDKFQEHYLEYTSALEGNMNAIQTDNFSSVIPLTDYPKLSEEFEKVLGKAQEKRNKELELECVICTVEMDLEKQEELFKCPGCKKFTHLHCIEAWFKKSPNCPHCRATWN